MLSDEEGFAEKVLTVAPAERFEEIGAGILDEGFEVLEVGGDKGYRLLPGVGRWGLGGLRPIVVGPCDGMVATGGGRREVEDVALGDAQVLEELPGGVGQVGWNGATVLGREVSDGFVEGDVSLTAF
jgi:hypothetical protein